MHQREPATGLTRTEADLRRGLLRVLQDALADRQVASALAGRRTLVLRSEQERKRSGGCGQRLTDPELYVFASDRIDVVTTDGGVYRVHGRELPVADPDGAARAYLRSLRKTK
jgi:hypothetical protein